MINVLQMSISDWFNQEANIKPYEDFLVSRHDYLLERLTSSALFDASDISQLASEIVLTLYMMDCAQDRNVSYIVLSACAFWGACNVFRAHCFKFLVLYTHQS
jgi:hypothetical protein